MFCQPELEALLERRADTLPGVTIHRGVEVTGLTQADDHVAVGDADGTTWRARYVVGCDGANSTVRELVGIAMVAAILVLVGGNWIEGALNRRSQGKLLDTPPDGDRRRK